MKTVLIYVGAMFAALAVLAYILISFGAKEDIMVPFIVFAAWCVGISAIAIYEELKKKYN